jgi:lipid II:glycine glycyltransferase (peptidoglycan interpeptide bridge formation enzyme)
MSVRIATLEEIANWDSLILSSPDGGNIFSSFEYADQKRLTGYIPRFLIVKGTPVTVLEKNTPPLGKLWYLPKGPNVTTPKQLFDVLKELHQFARRRGVFTIRVEAELNRKHANTLTRKGMRKAAPIIPNPSTITLDISAPLDELLTSLPQKGRHAIRRAERDGVTIQAVKASDKNCKLMYALLKETAEGQFGIRSYTYFKAFWQRFEKANLGQLFFAYVDDRPVAGAYAMVFGTKSTYKDGASVRDRTVYGASHLLQWRVIEWAKSRGATLHDFCGSPPSDEINNTEHPHYGVGRFKLAFSKHVVDYIGCYDWVIGPFRYSMWTKIAERLYRKVYFQQTKDYYY